MKHSRTITLATFTLCTLTLVSCGSNQGGDTTCGDYLELSSSSRTDVIEKFLSDSGDSNAGMVKINLTKGSVLAYCNTVGSSSDPIRNING